MNTGVLGNSLAYVCRQLNSEGFIAVRERKRGQEYWAQWGRYAESADTQAEGSMTQKKRWGRERHTGKAALKVYEFIRNIFHRGSLSVFCISVLHLIEIRKCVNIPSNLHHTYYINITQLQKRHRYTLVSIQMPRWAGLAPLWKLLFISLTLPAAQI